MVLLVIRHKVMSLSEFYAATLFDINLLASHLEEVERDAWERTRMMMWAVLEPHSKSKQGPEDLMTFSWEQHVGNSDTPPTTKQQFDEMFKRFKKA